MPLMWRSPSGARRLRMATSGTITSQATPIFLFDSGVQKRTYLDRPVSALLPEPSTRLPSASNARALSWYVAYCTNTLNGSKPTGSSYSRGPITSNVVCALAVPAIASSGSSASGNRRGSDGIVSLFMVVLPPE